MFISLTLFFLSAFIFTSSTTERDIQEHTEPKCYSRFDYDLKVLEAIASLKASEKQMREKMISLQNTVDRLQDHEKALPRTVAFMAQLSSSMEIQPLGEVHRPIIFDQVSTNTGSAYNKYTGGFTAPYDASYYFNLDVSSPPHSDAHRLHIHLLSEGNVIGYLFLDYHTQYWLRRSLPVTTYLSKGDTVQAVVVISDGNRGNTVAGCCLHSTFSGFLIGSD